MFGKNNKLWLPIVTALILLLPLVGCRPAGPELSSEPLRRGCTFAGVDVDIGATELTTETVLDVIDSSGLRVGERAIDFTLRDTDGTKFRLGQLLAEKPVMMEIGSYT